MANGQTEMRRAGDVPGIGRYESDLPGWQAEGVHGKLIGARIRLVDPDSIDRQHMIEERI